MLLPAVVVANDEEKIGLVLGGGGARGAAHVGVLKALEREGVAIDYVAGTSMGAIVGALYASGYRPDEIEEILTDIEWGQSLQDRSPRERQSLQRKLDASLIPSSLEVGLGPDGLRLPQGVLQGQHVMLLLRRLLAGAESLESFDDLPIPFRAVAADLSDGSRVVLGSGDLATAVKASMSLPGIFQPVRQDGRVLVDGGIVDNVPVSVVRAMGATRVIAVDVGTPPEDPDDLGSPVSVLNQIIALMMIRRTKEELESLGEKDLLIVPELGNFSSAAFDLSAEAVPIGERAAAAEIARLRSFAASPARWVRFDGRLRLDSPTGREVAAVIVDDRASNHGDLVEARAEVLAGETLSAERVEERIDSLYGSGYFERIGYRTQPRDDGRVDLVLQPVDRSWGPNFLRLGLQLSDDFQGRSGYQIDGLLRLQSEGLSEAEWRLRAGLGRETLLSGEWQGYFGDKGQFYVRPSAGWREIDQPVFDDRLQDELARYRWDTLHSGLQLGWDFNETTRIYSEAAFGRDRLRILVGDPDGFAEGRQDFGRIDLGIVHDSLDSIAFPSSGQRYELGYGVLPEGLGNPRSTEVAYLDLHGAYSLGPVNLLSSLSGNYTRDGTVTLQGLGFLGGLANLSGFGEREIVGSQTVLARQMAMVRLTDESRLFSLPVYLGASIEAGNAWIEADDIDVDDLVFAGSLFLGISTPLGPVFVGAGLSDQDRTAFYLHFGSLIRSRD